jgi:cell division protease FtsH
MKQKINAWFQGHPWRTTIVITAALASVIAAALAVSVTTRTGTPDSATISVPTIDQTYAVVKADLNPVDWQPRDRDTEAGLLPVLAVSADTALRALVDGRGISDISINPDTSTVAYVREIANSDTGQAIYAAVLLPLQLDAATTALTEARATIQVVRSTATPMPVIPRTSATADTSGPTTGSTVVPYRGSWTPTAAMLPVGETNPYLRALVTQAQAAQPSSGAPGWLWLLWLIPLAFLFWYAFAVSRRTRQGGAGRGSSSRLLAPVKTDDSTGVPATRFADIAGCDEAIEDMRELVTLLSEPERFTRVGAHVPRGALLVGPPGTGKTLLARAVAGEAGVPFYAAAGSDFVEMYVGVGAKRVRELFDKARKHDEGAIIFIDEIDAIGRRRSDGKSTGSNSEGENTLNALLVEMDGFSASNIIVLAATNRDDMLDPALTRPGRFDRKVQVPLPDRAGRERILTVHAAGKPLAADVDMTLVARRTPGMSGAELSQLINEACMGAARARRDTVTVEDLDDAIATITMGKARTSAVVSEEDRIFTAWHEAGHAVCGLAQPDAVNPVSISIIPRGPAGGVTHFPQRDGMYMTRRQAYSQLVTAMGGMAAEQMHLGDHEFTTGPSGDLQSASNLALAMVTQYGMGERLLVKSDSLLSASGSATDEAVSEADSLMRRALADARELLTRNRALVESLVGALLDHETLDHRQIADLMEGRTVTATTTPPPAPRQRPEEPPAGDAPHPSPLPTHVRFESPRRKSALRVGPFSVQVRRVRGRAR